MFVRVPQQPRFKSDHVGIERRTKSRLGGFSYLGSNQTMLGLKDYNTVIHGHPRGVFKSDHVGIERMEIHKTMKDQKGSNQTMLGLKVVNLLSYLLQLLVQIRPCWD